MYAFVLAANYRPLVIFTEREYLVDVLAELHAYGSAVIHSNKETGELFADVKCLPDKVLEKYNIPKLNTYRISRAPTDKN